MLKKIKKLWVILKYFFTDEDNLLLHLMEIKAHELLQDCKKLEVGATEEIEDLIFHIRSYYDIPENVININYPELQNIDVKNLFQKFDNNLLSIGEIVSLADFFGDVEKQRAVERDIIFEHAKALSFGFNL